MIRTNKKRIKAKSTDDLPRNPLADRFRERAFRTGYRARLDIGTGDLLSGA
jgi:hypothetical protein